MIRFALAFMCFPIVVWADSAPIRTGEHETFSRFVIGIGSGTPWSVEQTGSGFLLTLSGHEDGFDTSAVFERIPRERVLNVLQIAKNELLFEVDCDCEADAFLWKSGQLVVDIVSSTPSVSETENNQPQFQSSQPFLVSENSGLELPNLLVLQNASLPPLSLANPVVPTASAAVAFDDDAPVAQDRTDIAATEAALLEGLARAASQGFLDPNITSHADPEPVQEDVPVDKPPQNAQSVEPVVSGHPGIGISTAMDRDLSAIRDILGAEIGQKCLSADLFQIDQWGDGRALYAQVADLAEALAGEFGEQPLEAQNQLARLYLHFGFGVEARNALASDPAQSQDRLVLLQLAGLIDEYDVETDLIVAQAGCDTSGAMWAFIAQPTEIDEDRKNHITQSFLALPQPLRGQMAPRLARYFTDVGEVEAAAQLLRATDRNDSAGNHETIAVQALVAEHQDHPEEAMAALKEEAEDNGRISPDSLIRLIELGVENESLPDESDLILAAAMRQEHRGTPTADRLALAEAIARVQLEQYQAAFDLLEQRDDQEALDALNFAVIEMTERAEAATFLGFAFEDTPSGLTSHSENLIAARLIEIGFSERAADFLVSPAQREAAAERRYLRAQAAIGVEDYISAIEGLIGLTTSRANELRARAYTGLGDHNAVLSAQSIDNTEVDGATLQFRAEAWDRLTLEDDEALSAFAETVLSRPVEDPIETLFDRREVLSQSQESRRAVEALLSRFDGPIAPD
ncbi:hypothetical protein Q4555_09295 [Octadecabacter sp. 1_MG-2023]|uniref:hypothetical protein n=1 Tax=unclassified Octadecabacter TaxID=196158 RepID=UPI001C092633|nr:MULTISPECIES: hypothetical protein [unclassified Octadecabacter]MBU2992377.1 hypothetical protein [Octadecabacter sp. B2R22]MDO6734866.1 hypothetical protein [Octadecabacter sp. 1_MG-2023]